jgi:hypothetical protein
MTSSRAYLSDGVVPARVTVAASQLDIVSHAGQQVLGGSQEDVKYRNNSSLLISGNGRSCSYCSRENIFSDTQPPPLDAPERQFPVRSHGPAS